MAAHPTPHATWRYDPTEITYTLVQGDSQCRVWHIEPATWAAVDSRRVGAIAAYNFRTPDEAKHWREQQLVRNN